MTYWYSSAPLVAILLLFVGGATIACGSTAPETVHYRLDVQPRSVEDTSTQRPVMGIEHFTVDAAYDDTQIVYRRSPYRLDYYFYHRWASMPGQLITDTLRRGYQQTGRFHAVTTDQIARTDVVLSGHVAAIEEVDISEEEWIGRIVLELRLRDAATGTLLWSGVVEEEEPLDERSPSGLAQAVSEAVTRIVDATGERFANLAIQAGR
ncbi:MAG: ABC-type transport auxiliary lipoprotein family protein [Persicimonas sp.]